MGHSVDTFFSYIVWLFGRKILTITTSRNNPIFISYSITFLCIIFENVNRTIQKFILSYLGSRKLTRWSVNNIEETTSTGGKLSSSIVLRRRISAFSTTPFSTTQTNRSTGVILTLTMTFKLSHTRKIKKPFSIIDVPWEFRSDAVQWGLLLLPDENREALEVLLDFLNYIASNSFCNQMTASNLAVCLVPSLFHLHHSNTNASSRPIIMSPRRGKSIGDPDQRELAENKAAHECLVHLIKTNRKLFMVIHLIQIWVSNV